MAKKYVKKYQCVQVDGGIWRLSMTRYKSLISAIKDGEDVSITDYGEYIGDMENLRDLLEEYGGDQIIR